MDKSFLRKVLYIHINSLNNPNEIFKEVENVCCKYGNLVAISFYSKSIFCHEFQVEFERSFQAEMTHKEWSMKASYTELRTMKIYPNKLVI